MGNHDNGDTYMYIYSIIFHYLLYRGDAKFNLSGTSSSSVMVKLRHI